MSRTWLVSIGFAVLSAGCGNVVRPGTDAGETDAGGTDAALAPPTQVVLVHGGAVGILGAFGTQATDMCPSGQALIGYSGATGMFSASISVVGQLTGHCGSFHVASASSEGRYAVMATTGALLTALGMNTIARWDLSCPADQFIVGLEVRAGSALDQLTIRCAPVSLVASSGAWVGEVGVTTPIGPAGGDGGGELSGACPAGQIATISNTRVLTSPVVMGGIGLGCSIVSGR